MKRCTAVLRSISPLSQSRQLFDMPRNEKEDWDAYEARVWRHKMHTTPDGEVFIPPMGLKQAVDDAAKFLSIPIKGKGKANYTKHFRSGVLCTEPVKIGVKAADVKPETISANADGVRGSGKRVPRTFPTIQEWKGQATFMILDDVITEDVFIRVLKEAGALIGVGRFRPINGGYYGRFTVDRHEWQDAA